MVSFYGSGGGGGDGLSSFLFVREALLGGRSRGWKAEPERRTRKERESERASERQCFFVDTCSFSLIAQLPSLLPSGLIPGRRTDQWKKCCHRCRLNKTLSNADVAFFFFFRGATNVKQPSKVRQQ
jgi:hypothetical protein